MILFKTLIILHVITGSVALISFWVPVVARKGGALHRKAGRLFSRALYAAAWCAIGMALLNLSLANDRHPALLDRDVFDGLFGWMMLYLGVLTIGLGHYGMATARSHGRSAAIATPLNIAVQCLVIALALKCGIEGYRLSQPLMIGLAALGFGAASTFLIAMARPSQRPRNHVREHLKAMVGAGISAYTAFLSVGLLQIFPDHVFNPAIWSIPSAIGVTLILFHFRRLDRSSAVATAVATDDKGLIKPVESL
jgi:hypothetical protein